MLIGAGSETTTNLLSGLLLTLAQRPELYAQLREHPELIPAAIEEQLRFVSPVQGFYRTATRDYTVGANTIPAGARVLLLFAAANRDPRHFEDPDNFDLNRNPSDHLAFGVGIHYCLGTPLTRLEAGRVLRNCFRGSMPSVSTGNTGISTTRRCAGWCICPSSWSPPDRA